LICDRARDALSTRSTPNSSAGAITKVRDGAGQRKSSRIRARSRATPVRFRL
jgi:hypothetical protein